MTTELSAPLLAIQEHITSLKVRHSMSMLSLPSFISPCYLLPTSYTHAVSNTHFPPSLFLFYWTFLNCHFFSFFSWLLYFRMLEKQSVELQQHRLHCVRGESAQLWFWKCLKIYTYLCCACVHMCLWCCQHFETYYIFHNHDIICSAFSSLRGRVILWA